jgi:hypothetical protein
LLFFVSDQERSNTVKGRHFDLFDDFVGARENRWREGRIERFRGFEINHEFELAGLQYGQVCGICALRTRATKSPA